MRASQDVAARLEEARSRTSPHLSIRQLQQRLRLARVRGASYPNVYAILKGRQVPGVAFLEAAARELGVSAAWLVLGEGPETPAAGIMADAATRSRAPVPDELWLRRATKDGKRTRAEAIAQWQERQQREEPLILRAEAANVDYQRHAEAVRAAFARAFFPAADDGGGLWAAAAQAWHRATWQPVFGIVPEWRVDYTVEELKAIDADQRRRDLKAAQGVGRALAAPLQSLGVEPNNVSPWQLQHYVTLVSAALEAVLIGKAEVEFRRLHFTIGKPLGRAPREAAGARGRKTKKPADRRR